MQDDFLQATDNNNVSGNLEGGVHALSIFHCISNILLSTKLFQSLKSTKKRESINVMPKNYD